MKRNPAHPRPHTPRAFGLLPSFTKAAMALTCLTSTTMVNPALAQTGYEPKLTLLPRKDQGLGTLSAYGGVTPAFKKDAGDRGLIMLPKSGKNEVNLLWTFWGHTKPKPEAWPRTESARTVFTVQSTEDTSLSVRVTITGANETPHSTSPEVTLAGGVPTRVEVPLPAYGEQVPVERIRLQFVGKSTLPRLYLTDWSIGEGGTIAQPIALEPLNPPLGASGEAKEVKKSTPIAAGTGFFVPQLTLVPGGGEGRVSEYGGLKVSEEKDAGGREIVSIAPSGKKELNLYWTFWGHKRPGAELWPAGTNARSSVTLTSASDIAVKPLLKVNASGEWSDPIEGGEVTLTAGKPVTIDLPLPEQGVDGAVENLHILLTANEPVPALTITDWAVGEQAVIALYEPEARMARTTNPVPVKGRTDGKKDVVVQAKTADGSKAGEWKVTAAEDGTFEISVDKNAVPEGPLTLRASANADAGDTAVWSADVPLYIYPLLKKGETLAMVQREGRDLLVNGKPWAFLGLNYTRFLLEFSLKTNYNHVAEEMRKYGEWGITMLRVPLHLGMFQPREGVFPDSPEYAEILKSHNLDAEFFDLFEYMIAVAGHHGIRVVLDWHEMPNDPYRYFVGGNLKEKEAGESGKGIAWLYDQSTKTAAEPGDPRFNKAIADTNRWLAKRFRGNGNIFGFEVPYNEPHSVTDSADTAWRKLTAEAILPILLEDPERLTFGMPPAWGHSNVLPSVTWMLPDFMSGIAPHHYIGNGPVAARPDAPTRKSPWLARNVDDTFSHSFYAATLPHSAAPYPVWNGESGEHGFESLFPDMDRRKSTIYMIEGQMVQAYAAGWAGCLGWTLTGNKEVYDPVADIYEDLYRKFSPVFAAGTVEMDDAEVLFVQNPSATPIGNGLNHACVPLARLVLDLHLQPVHYMTDDQLLANGLVQMAVGLEQVEQMATGLKYKAAVVDTRNLDARALELLKGTKIPLLVINDTAELTPAKLSEFLTKANVAVDTRTPAELQLIEGPAHLLVYRRAGEGSAKVYPKLRSSGRVRLVDEQGRTAYTGTTEALSQRGIDVNVEKWRTAVFEIRSME